MKSANVRIQDGKGWSSQEQPIIDEFVTHVRDTFKERAKRIILYGSRARGDADEESDYDFVVLLDPFYKNDKETLSDLGYEVACEFNAVIVAFAIALNDFREDKLFYFYENVCKEGVDF